MKRRKIGPQTKMAAVLEGPRGESSSAETCRKYQISESLYYRWRDKFLEGGGRALASRNGSDPEYAVKARDWRNVLDMYQVFSRYPFSLEASS